MIFTYLLTTAQRDGDEKRSYLFLRQEIPTRLANMVKVCQFAFNFCKSFNVN